jgi:hypothetical protein
MTLALRLDLSLLQRKLQKVGYIGYTKEQPNKRRHSTTVFLVEEPRTRESQNAFLCFQLAAARREHCVPTAIDVHM